MKKTIKIFLLILLITFTIGITTSNADSLTVTKDTTAAEMLEALNNGKTLTGISDKIRDQNQYLLCSQKWNSLYSSAKYAYEKDNNDNIKYTTYPKDDSTRGYAKAYILAAPGYVKSDASYSIPTKADERQWAWYCCLNEDKKDSDASYETKIEFNDLYKTAMEYQEYKQKGEKSLKLVKDDTKATTKTNGNDVIYGPFQIEYSYKKATTGKDEWGGFDYAFFDENGNNISSKIQLCTLSVNDEYVEIDSTGESNEYYKVRTEIYNMVNLYIKTEVKTISKVEIKIKANSVNYEAKLFALEGEVTFSHGGMNLCDTCRSKYSNAEDMTTNANECINSTKTYFSYNYAYYVYTGTATSLGKKYSQAYDYVVIDGSNSTIQLKIAEYETATLYSGDDTSYESKQEAIKSYIYFDGSDYWCKYCGYGKEGTPNGSAVRSHAEQHIIEYTDKIYYPKAYKFVKVNGCGKSFVGSKHSWNCGSTYEAGTYESQALSLIESTSSNLETKEEVDIDIELAVTIEVNKVWKDNSDKSEVRPEDIKLSVYRSIDKQDWTLLTDGEDYKLEWTDKKGNTWKALITGLERIDANGNKYYFKVEEEKQNYYNIKYSSATVDGKYTSSNIADVDVDNKKIKITNEIKYLEIDITKKWEDYSNAYGFRPDTIEFNVFRSIDQKSWEKLALDKDYKVIWKTTDGDTWTASISELLGVDANGNEYYFKVEEQALDYYKELYPSGNIVQYEEGYKTNPSITINNTYKLINISGYVWLDGQTGIKPAVEANGIMDETETKMEGITVYLYYKNPSTEEISKIATTVTDKNGYYEFKDCEIGNYYVEFEYDGINYQNTISGGSSKAFENETNRETFNGRFQTITYGKSNDGTDLKYNYEDRKSTLITNEEGTTKIANEFIMNAKTTETLYTSDTENLNLGLVKRGVDIALSTDVYDAKVSINGQTTDYKYNRESNTIEITSKQTNEDVAYNLNIYGSDYTYRIRDYVNTQDFQEKNYISNETSGITTGDELNVSVIYELNLQNQSTEEVAINEVTYIYDEKYTFAGFANETWNYTIDEANHILTIDLRDRKLTDGETKTIYIVFEVSKVDNTLNLGEFSNKAEITSYSTDKGLIDTDSQPGNFINDNQVEDDSDTARGIKISVPDNYTRRISGMVFDTDGNKVNDVIVQLIELKTVNNKIFEYIWQETNSGTNSGLRLNANGTALENYTYSNAEGYYEFNGFIPGDYIVRFIYGDGTTYDMTENVIKYNGQDYKSVKDANYNAEWYNSSSYAQGASVARDNEARRLETMAYAVNIDTEKGLLLKLLDNVELNLTEKETLISIYNEWNDAYSSLSDITYTNISEVSDEVIDAISEVLVLREVLPNTWMCAETSKIKVSVDTDNSANVGTETTVNGINRTGTIEIANVNLGLEVRPATKIELKKYITGFKLVASNGQTLVNAYVDVNEYLNNSNDISNKVQGIKDNVTILNTVWQYEVSPTEINTVVDGAKLEFEYTLVVKNTGDTDYLSAELAEAYANNSITEYSELLKNKASTIKGYMTSGIYRTQIGSAVGRSYYAGGTGSAKVLTEITNINDYVNNELEFITTGGDAEVDETQGNSKHRILRDDYTMQEATIKTVLKTTKSTGKMQNDGAVVLYTVTLGKNPISSTGKLNFENYIAEVMSYTNAAGRRSMTSTPGNAEIIDAERREGKTHEIDEADTGRIQVGAATGEDGKTNYIIVIAVAGALVVMAVGAYIVKKYVIK